VLPDEDERRDQVVVVLEARAHDILEAHGVGSGD
jgi:hypothetical protein